MIVVFGSTSPSFLVHSILLWAFGADEFGVRGDYSEVAVVFDWRAVDFSFSRI